MSKQTRQTDVPDELTEQVPEKLRGRFALVRNYMAHHIGMSLVALTNLLERGVWPRRFHADPLVRSAELLLHERIPRVVVLHHAQAGKPKEALPDPDLERSARRQADTPFTPQPLVALLGSTGSIGRSAL